MHRDDAKADWTIRVADRPAMGWQMMADGPKDDDDTELLTKTIEHINNAPDHAEEGVVSGELVGVLREQPQKGCAVVNGLQ